MVATANTKGKGSEDGRFIGTNILNEAFLERFAICLEQEYPPVTTEKKIVKGDFAILGVNDDEFANKLVDWADVIRKSFYEGAVDEVISTRRLVHIAKAYSMFNDKLKSIEVCLARFDEDTKHPSLTFTLRLMKESILMRKLQRMQMTISSKTSLESSSSLDLVHYAL